MLISRCLEPAYLLDLECRRVTELDGPDLFMMKESAFFSRFYCWFFRCSLNVLEAAGLDFNFLLAALLHSRGFLFTSDDTQHHRSTRRNG